MEGPTPIVGHPLLGEVARRIRIAWALAIAQWFAPVVAVSAAALVGLVWLFPVSWPSRAAFALACGALVVWAAATARLHVSPAAAARAADVGLDASDVISTALEIETTRQTRGPDHVAPNGLVQLRGDVLGDLVVARARTVLDRHRAAEAVRLPVLRARLVVAGVAAAATAFLVIGPNPQDELRERQRAERTVLRTEAAALHATASAMARSAKTSEQRRIAEAVANEAEAVARERSIDTARERLHRAAAELRRQIAPEYLSQRAAATGLERSVANRPLLASGDLANGTSGLTATPGAAGGAGSRATGSPAVNTRGAASRSETEQPGRPDASAQLRSAATALRSGQLDKEATQQLAQRMAALAATQQLGDPTTAQAMSDAAAALQAGDNAAAASALDRAAATHDDARERDADAAADIEAAQELEDAATKIEQARNGTGRGSGVAGGQSTNPGAGSGPGNDRRAANAKKREGKTGAVGSAGSGSSGAGTGSPSGAASGAKTGTGQGTGGKGKAGKASGAAATKGDGAGGPAKEPTFAPGSGERIVAGGGVSSNEGVVVDRVPGPVRPGVALVEVAESLPSYRAEVGRALASLEITTSQRAVVRTYFESLGTAADSTNEQSTDQRTGKVAS